MCKYGESLDYQGIFHIIEWFITNINIMIESSYFVPWMRRYLSARRKCWRIVYEMYKSKVNIISWLEELSRIFYMRKEVIKRQLRDRLYENWNKLCISLHKDDLSVISEAEKVSNYINSLDPDKKHLFQMVLSYLSEEEKDII